MEKQVTLLMKDVSPVSLSGEEDEKYKKLHGTILSEGTFHGITGGKVHYPWETIKAGSQSFNLTYVGVDHDESVLSRRGWLDNVVADDATKKLEADFIIPRIPHNKQVIDLIDAEYKGQRLLGDVSVTMSITEGEEPSLVEKYGVYASSITGRGVDFVTRGACPNAKITNVLNKEGEDMTEEKVEQLLSDKVKLNAQLEKEADLAVEREGELASLKQKLEAYERAEKERIGREVSELKADLVKRSGLAKDEVDSMSREQLQAALKVAAKLKAEPERKTLQKTEAISEPGYKPKNQLTYNVQSGGKLEFYASRPAYIPDHVPGSLPGLRVK